MIPTPIPEEPGCLSIRTHAGSRPPEIPLGQISLPGIGLIPVKGSVGRDDPDEWLHVLWFKGIAFRATLLCDVIGHRPTLLELMSHYERYQTDPKSPWVCISPVSKS